MHDSQSETVIVRYCPCHNMVYQHGFLEVQFEYDCSVFSQSTYINFINFFLKVAERIIHLLDVIISVDEQTLIDSNIIGNATNR